MLDAATAESVRALRPNSAVGSGGRAPGARGPVRPAPPQPPHAAPAAIETPRGAARASIQLGSADIGGFERQSFLLGLVAAACEHRSFAKAAGAVASEIAVALSCDRTSVGFVARRLVKVEAVSHSADIRSRAKQLLEIGAAMDECLDQSGSIRYPPLPGEQPRITLAHAELAQRHASGAILTVPLVRAGELIGAITCERRNGQHFDEATVALLEDVGVLVGPLLDLERDTERSGFARLGNDLTTLLRKIGGREHRRVKVLLATALVLLAAVPFVPVDFRVSAPARLEGAVQRTMVAPADGFLKLAHARPGDLVKQGQLLVELADDDLNFEKRRWESEVSRYEGTFAEALARQDRAQVVIAQARAAEARAQLDLVNQHLLRGRVTAPFDGVVIAGDLRQKLGAPVKRGDTLMVVAPANEFRVIVEVEDRDIGEMNTGQRGEIALAARPNRNYPITVERIKPVATVRDGRNFFEVEAALGQVGEGLRPGLEGVAKVDIDTRPLYWVIGHRAIDWLRLALWSWTH